MTRVARYAWFGLAAALCLVGCGAAGKKDADEPKGEVTIKTMKRLGKVRELSEKSDWEGALAELDEIAESKYLNPYEQAKIWQARAMVHFGKNGGLPSDEMVHALEQALALDVLGKQDRLDTTFGLGKAYFVLERFEESADTFGRWAKDAEDPKPEENYVIASSYFQAKRYEEALPYAKKAVKESSDKVPEGWYRLLVELHFELKQNDEAAVVQKQLVAAYPNKEHQLELSQRYLDAGDDKKAIATLEQLHAKGELTSPQEIVALAQLYQRNGAPLKGAALLEKGMESGKIEKSKANVEALVLCYIVGKDADNAEATMEEAGEDAFSGDLYFELALVRAQRGEWADARDAVAAAIQKGVKSPGDAQILLGVAHYNTKRKDAALASLSSAKRHGPAAAKCADAWIKVVKSGHGKASCPGSAVEEVTTAQK